ncbi:hypothetical protein RR46_05423 [Papilio xuthus]|uniref:Tc1-like transposase DDE domain-containing protein n=1 Tax=Papilio xuthus TaxID=66420 RepID=A0A194Q2L3_PAPXU|nr:hypothetical protein RR46_05423 [Papilio xuthus]
MKTAIRKKIYDFYLRGEPAYKDKVFKDINDDPMLPYFKMRLFDRMLNHFKMFTLNKRANYALIDRMRISVNRIEYLQKLKELRAQKRCFYYLDELFLPAENTDDKNQPSTSAKKKPTQKYMVIAHIGNENGFIDDGLGVFHVDIEPSSRNKIETNQFEEWFEKILPKLEKNSVILMDSAPYHIRRPDIIPNWQWSTNDIERWFSTSGLEYYENSSKVLLLHTIKEAKIEQPPFIIDTMAMKYNIEIIRTPQFHYDLNPINVIWAEIKKIVAKRTLNIEHLREIVDSVICDKSSIEKWRTSIQYVLDLEENYYGKLDGAMDDVVDSNLDESEEADGPNEYPAENQAIYLYSGSDDCIWENVITDLSEIGTDTDSSYVYYDKSIFNYVFISPASRKSS